MTSTLPSPAISLAAGATTAIDVDLIDPSPLNPRQDVDGDLAVGLLAVGQLEAILVRPKPGATGRFELANGHRRWAGAKRAGIKSLSARVREMTDAQMLDVMLGTGTAGNVKPLTPIDEGVGYARALTVMKNSDGKPMSQRELAEHFGVSFMTLHERLALVNLPADGKAAVASRDLGAKTGYLIARVDDAAWREKLTKLVLHSPGGVMSHAATKAYIFENVCRPLRGAGFDQADVELVPAAGACGECPWNTARDREAYHDAPVGACMRPACFEQKVEASRARKIAREEKAGKKWLGMEVNARAFPPGTAALAWNSGFVELGRPPAADLLKKEVVAALQPGSKEAAMLRVPTWRELLPTPGTKIKVRTKVRNERDELVDKVEVVDAPEFTVWFGFDQTGRVVDLVKIEEALLAADESERPIFNAETIKRFNLEKGAVTLKAERGRKLGAGAKPAAPANAGGSGGGEDAGKVQSDQDQPLVARLCAWIERTMEATPALPPGLRAEGLRLVREGAAEAE